MRREAGSRLAGRHHQGADPIGPSRRWEILPQAGIGGSGDAPIRVDAAALHPGRGIALIDIAPKATSRAAETLRGRLALAVPDGMPLPPVVYLCLAPEELADLPTLLDGAFARAGPAPRPAEAWLAAARRVLAKPAEAAGPAGPDPMSPWPALRTPRPGRRAVRIGMVGLAGSLAAMSLFLGLAIQGPDPAARAPGGMTRQAALAPAPPATAAGPEAAETAPPTIGASGSDPVPSADAAESVAGAHPAGSIPEPAPPAALPPLRAQVAAAPPGAPGGSRVAAGCAPLLARLQMGELPTHEDRQRLRSDCATRP